MNGSTFIFRLFKKTINFLATLAIVFSLISYKNGNASIKQSILHSDIHDIIEVGSILLRYPDVPIVLIDSISDFATIELKKNGNIHLKISKYGNDVFLVEKNVEFLDESYDFILNTSDHKIYQGKIKVVFLNKEPDIKYYTMYKAGGRRTLKLFDCLAFEGNYPKKKLKYIVNNKVKQNENFSLESSKIEQVSIGFLADARYDWEIKIITDKKFIVIRDNHDENKVKFSLSNLGIKKVLSKPPKTRKDWECFDYIHQDNPGKNIEFYRNGAKVKIQNDKIAFMDNGYFKTGPFIVKLEQDKLIVTTEREIENLRINADNSDKIGKETHLKGNSTLALNEEYIFKANEIVFISN